MNVLQDDTTRSNDRGKKESSFQPCLASVKIRSSLDVGDDGLELLRIFEADHEEEEEEESEATAEAWVNQGSTLLDQQWPRGASPVVETYRQKIVHSYHGRVEYYGLPCSYLLLKDNICIGHGRLTECFESAGGNAAAATFIVIDSKFRGQGVGRHLMKFLEEEASRLGYHYIYLWTKTAIPFYQKIGYTICQRVSLKRACLKALDASQVENLEALLFRKSQRQSTTSVSLQKSSPAAQQHANSTTKQTRKAETILLPPSNDGDDENAQDVWLRKRLVEHVGSVHVSSSERRDELTEVVANNDTSMEQHNLMKWRYFLLSLPWQSQIGPSCGLAALRMTREYFFLLHHHQQSKPLVDDKRENSDEPAQLPSLLGEAQERGYTNDGEVFNANHLMDIAETVCGLDCEMWSTKDLQPQQVWNVLRDGGVLLLPYDSGRRTRLPALLGGKSAHYGIIVGLLVGTIVVGGGTSRSNKDDKQPIVEVVEEGSKARFEELEELEDIDDSSELFLLVQHSLSSKLSIARWSDFLLSNQQLDSMDQGKFGEQDLDLKYRIIHCKGMRPDAF